MYERHTKEGESEKGNKGKRNKEKEMYVLLDLGHKLNKKEQKIPNIQPFLLLVDSQKLPQAP